MLLQFGFEIQKGIGISYNRLRSPLFTLPMTCLAQRPPQGFRDPQDYQVATWNYKLWLYLSQKLRIFLTGTDFSQCPCLFALQSSPLQCDVFSFLQVVRQSVCLLGIVEQIFVIILLYYNFGKTAAKCGYPGASPVCPSQSRDWVVASKSNRLIEKDILLYLLLYI